MSSNCSTEGVAKKPKVILSINAKQISTIISHIFFLSVIYLHTYLFILHIYLLFNHSIVRKKSGKLRNIAVNKL